MSQQIQYDLESNKAYFLIDEAIYPLDAIYGACYLFVEKCYVFLAKQDGLIRAELKGKEDISEEELEALVGEFANELLNQTIRVSIGKSTGQIREYTMARAFVSTPAQASIEALLAELDAEELEEDDLDIQVPWDLDGAGS